MGTIHPTVLKLHQQIQIESENLRWNIEDSSKLVQMVVAECIDSIETYRIPIGNSTPEEMLREWTYDALKEIRDEIKEKFGLE